MSRGCRWIGVGLIGLSGLAVPGCLGLGDHGAELLPKAENPAAQIAPQESPAPRLARSQRPEGVSLSRPRPADHAPAPDPGIAQTSLSPRPGVQMNVRAWVNGKPIFEDEVFWLVGPELRQIQTLPEPRRSEVLAERLNGAIDTLIDQEVLYQDGVNKLEKANPRALDKLKEFVNHEFEKQVVRMQKAGLPPEQLKEIEPVAKRTLQRSLISMEYVRSRIMGYVESQVSLDAIKEYYEEHKNEFQTVDKVKWQDVFIAAGPGTRHATPADARRFAEEQLSGLRTPDEFSRLLAHDDGDSKLRGGEGVGQRRGEIQPPVLEEYLFKMRDGEIGPIVEVPSGVHLIRVLKRDYAGQVPLNDETQKTIRKKLQNQLADREYKRVVRELRGRAIIRKETGS